MKKKVIPQSGMLSSLAAWRLGGEKGLCRVQATVYLFLTVVMVLLLAAPLAAQSDAPLDVIRTNVEKVLGVLRDPALQDEAAESQKKEAIRNISNDMFHWDLLSKRVLAKNWAELDAGQQEEFISLFKVILEKAYIDRILAYKDETIEYVSNQMLTDNKAEVETQIVSGGAPINLTYRLGLLGGKWGVYDVIVEGVSLTSNYRTQFRDFLADKTPVELLEHLRGKVGEE